MLLYRTKSYSIDIEEIEVERKTDHNVFYMQSAYKKPTLQKEAIRSSYTNWHDTYEDARKFLLERENKRKIELEKGLAEVLKKIEKL